MRRLPATVLFAGALTLAAACDADAPAEFTVDHAWARPTPAGATNGVIYLTVVADVDDTITAVSVPVDVAGAATLHAAAGQPATDEMMSMEPIESVELPAGEPFEFAPGGNHIMLEDLSEPLVLGEQFTVQLELESGRSSSVDVVVADNRPTD